MPRKTVESSEPIKALRAFAQDRLSGGRASFAPKADDSDAEFERYVKLDDCAQSVRQFATGLNIARECVRCGRSFEQSIEFLHERANQLLSEPYATQLGPELCAEIATEVQRLDRASAEAWVEEQVAARLGYASSVKRLATKLGHITAAKEMLTQTCASRPVSSDVRERCEAAINAASAVLSVTPVTPPG